MIRTDYIEFIKKRITEKENDREDLSRSYENRISIGGQLTAFYQILNYIHTHPHPTKEVKYEN